MIDPVPRSRKRIQPFRLHRPRAVAEAVALAAGRRDAAYMAGGIDLLNRMKAGLRVPDVILLADVAGLAEIAEVDGALMLGALVSLHALGTDGRVRARAPGLAAALAPAANVRIRHQATLGGNLMAQAPHYDVLPALLAAGATLHFGEPDGARGQAAAGFARSGPPTPDSLLVAAEIPAGADVRAFSRDHLPAFLITVGHDAGSGTWRAAIAGAHAHPAVGDLDLPADPAPRLTPADARAAAEAWAARLPAMRDTLHVSAAYRRRVAPVVLGRLLAGLAATAEALAA